MRLFFAPAAIALIAALSGAGCSTIPSPSPSAPPQVRPRAIAETFNINGRIAARDVGDTKRGFSGGFAWKHTAADDVVELLTPLGQIAARVTMTKALTTVELADGQRTTTTDPDALVGRILGISLPIRALPYWMQGAPVPGSSMRAEADGVGRLSMLWQDGWQIRYAEYVDERLEANPSRLDLTYGDIEARIVIGEWNGS